MLRPMVHYVPVKNDLSDLQDWLMYFEAHEAESYVIGVRGMEVALKYTKEFAHLAIANLIDALVPSHAALVPSTRKVNLTLWAPFQTRGSIIHNNAAPAPNRFDRSQM